MEEQDTAAEEGTRTCAGCGRHLPAHAFAWRSKAEGRRHPVCRTCTGAYMRDWYAENAATHKARVQEGRKRRRSANRTAVAAAKDRPCADCGQRWQTEQMDFDHVRGVKRFDIASATASVSMARLLEEIDKCDVVCAVCHRLRTAARRS